MNMIKIFFVTLLLVSLLLASCRVKDVGVMATSEQGFQERQRLKSVTLMSIDRMFPDTQIRALAKAAGNGESKTIKDLVSQGADVNYRGTVGATPLFWALRNSNLEGFETLLELGADPNLEFSDSSVMHWSARHQNTSFLERALSYGGNPDLAAGRFGETPIFKTIGTGGGNNKPARMLLIDAGANVNAQTKGVKTSEMTLFGQTPLMYAAVVVRFDIVYELLNLGADYKLEDDIGRSLVDYFESINGRFKEGAKQQKYLNDVMLWLKNRGVEIPVE